MESAGRGAATGCQVYYIAVQTTDRFLRHVGTSLQGNPNKSDRARDFRGSEEKTQPRTTLEKKTGEIESRLVCPMHTDSSVQRRKEIRDLSISGNSWERWLL